MLDNLKSKTRIENNKDKYLNKKILIDIVHNDPYEAAIVYEKMKNLEGVNIFSSLFSNFSRQNYEIKNNIMRFIKIIIFNYRNNPNKYEHFGDEIFVTKVRINSDAQNVRISSIEDLGYGIARGLFDDINFLETYESALVKKCLHLEKRLKSQRISKKIVLQEIGFFSRMSTGEKIPPKVFMILKLWKGLKNDFPEFFQFLSSNNVISKNDYEIKSINDNIYTIVFYFHNTLNSKEKLDKYLYKIQYFPDLCSIAARKITAELCLYLIKYHMVNNKNTIKKLYKNNRLLYFTNFWNEISIMLETLRYNWKSNKISIPPNLVDLNSVFMNKIFVFEKNIRDYNKYLENEFLYHKIRNFYP